MPKFLRSILSHFGPSTPQVVRQVFTIRIVYKSGYVHDFDVYKFKIEVGGKYTWENVDANNQPLQLGVDDIAAVWQLGVK